MRRLLLLQLTLFFTTITFAQAVDSTGQDVFSFNNSEKYANYLFQSQQYRLAISEYERLVFHQPESQDLELRLVASYRLYGNYALAERRLNQFSNKTFGLLPLESYCLSALKAQGYTLPEDVSYYQEFIRLQIHQKQYDNAIQFLRCSGTALQDANYSNNLLIGNFLAAGQFQEAQHTIQPYTHPAFVNLMKEYDRQKNKSPFLAGSLSAIVPGAGKAYLNRWQDGAIGLLFVSVNGWAAYRAFSRGGIGSPYGWFFGTIGASFYIGNIVGASKGAKKYNNEQRNRIKSAAHETLIRLY